MTTFPLTVQSRKRAARAIHDLFTRAARYARPVKPVLRNLASVPFTLAGAACIDIGVFKANVVAGWIVTGISLIVIEHIIADED